MNEMKWIPVTERLPDMQDEVLTYSECNGVRAGSVIVEGGDNKETVWYLCRTGKVSIAVTHWMPLPKPPEVDNGSSEGLIQTVELAQDWNLPVPEKDRERYEAAILARAREYADCCLAKFAKDLIDRFEGGVIPISDLPDLLIDFKEKKNHDTSTENSSGTF